MKGQKEEGGFFRYVLYMQVVVGIIRKEISEDELVRARYLDKLIST